MKVRKKAFDETTGYDGFIERFRGNPVAFFKKCLLLEPSPQQAEIVFKLHPDSSRVSVASGHGTGKGVITAAYAIHFLLCHPKSLVMLTANNIDQVMRVIFKYVRQHWRVLEKTCPTITKKFTLTATSLYETENKDSWCIFGKTSSPGNEEALAGQHAEDMLVVVDEASGVTDKAFETIEGIFTQRNNKLLLTSQFTRPSGHFAESQSSLAKVEGNPNGIYDVIVLNSEHSPFVTTEAIDRYIKRFGGRDSPEYGIRVLGICPDNAEGYLIPRSLAARGFDATIEHDDDYGYVGCVDVATDGLRDKSEVTICKVSGYDDLKRVEVVTRWTAPPGMDGIRLATELEHMGKMYPNITWAIDGDGYGKATCQEAERLGLTVARINWGKPVHSKEKQDQYFNKRSYSAVMVRDALRDGRLKLKANSVKERDTTLTQFSKIPYGFTDGVARWKLKSKEWMRENGIKSPDIFDTHCFVWLVDYIPAGEDVVVANDDDAGDPWEGMLAS